MEFFPTLPFPEAISRTAYFFTTTALLQGTSNFFWMPLTNKYGRRPVYVVREIALFIVEVM
jgi:MFS family permease